MIRFISKLCRVANITSQTTASSTVTSAVPIWTTRDMREYYLSQYRKLIENDNLPSIMTCYNAVNGVPMSASKFLVDTIARKTYGLNGYITGDCGAIQDIVTGHLYARTNAEATALGLKSGVDTDCGSVYQTSAIDALNEGLDY